MAEVDRIDFEDATPTLDEEDEETLAAIDDGIRDAEGGRTASMQDVRRLVPTWITTSYLPKDR